MSDQEEQEHVQYQQSYFDRHCDIFRQPIPEDIDERTRLIVKAAYLKPSGHILDVGTGMGVLIKHFLEQGILPGSIIGCDLSSEMLKEAAKRYPEATFWQGDFKNFPTEFHKFEAIFFNACFGNIFDQDLAIEKAFSLLKPRGAIVISHPLGNKFVSELKAQDPKLVLTLMPTQEDLQEWARLGMEVETFVDDTDFYLAILRKFPAKTETTTDSSA